MYKDDIFISVAGTLGIVGRVPISLDGANLTENADRLTNIKCDVAYLMYALQSNPIQDEIDSIRTVGAQPKLALSRIRSFEILMPSDQAEQSRVSRALSDTDDLIESLERLISKKKAIKQGMMQELLTGRTRLSGFTEPWTNIVLGDVARFGKGSGLPKSALTSSGFTPCIHYGELFTHYGPEIIHVTSRTNLTDRMVVSEDFDVLMPTSDVTPRGLAKASSIHERGVVLGGDIMIIRPDKGRAHGPFLAHAIRHDANQVLQFVRGSTVYHLYAADMQNFTLAIPSVEEQRVIAQVLRDADYEIDTLHRRLESARNIKQGMMQELLTGRTRLPVEEVSS
ncbi:MAG: restriction endonuclease subunit S [Corynebacterium sp.]|nr:restriction endonuclease subunit S [Corynebacterium sp.]MDO5669003.1 restriction endonuclease subunit S [Corynebacterium sp.]